MSDSRITIRDEQPGDEAGIRRVHQAAFPTELEGQLIDDLRRAGRLTSSWVAKYDDDIVGHIAFSPVTVGDNQRGLGLAPLAVRPERQRQGIGGALIRAGVAACRHRDAGFIVVLGDPAYYGRFGFQPASQWQLADEYGGGDAFQALELIPGSIPAAGGLVRYSSEFAIFGPDDPNEPAH
ncbi:MAG TPA: N-acetyltransferase [Planctomycetaceae bacterium]|nr:N-acetyltransferase [Planctomycetaceae bacterium]